MHRSKSKSMDSLNNIKYTVMQLKEISQVNMKFLEYLRIIRHVLEKCAMLALKCFKKIKKADVFAYKIREIVHTELITVACESDKFFKCQRLGK